MQLVGFISLLFGGYSKSTIYFGEWLW